MSALDAASSPADALAPLAPALRIALVVGLDCAAVARCLGEPGELAGVWPSTLYAWAAETALRSPRVWARCATALDHALGGALPSSGSSAALARLLTERDGATALCAREIAAVLWALVRRREPALAPMIARLTREAEILLARRACEPRP
ncbi:MAG: hypothetical protein KF729_19500 [Sandaracinaceae bacterium]|nr:hypothetical protein [Sandaracinaceae bacterium]